MINHHKPVESRLLERNPEIEPYFYDIDKEEAARAYHGTSQYPERAGAILRMGYAQQLIADLGAIKKEVSYAQTQNADIVENVDEYIDIWFEQHRAALKEKYMDYVHSHSSVMSSMITGPANFPVARNQKRMDAAEKKYSLIGEFCLKSKKRLLKTILPFGDGSAIKTDDPNASHKITSKVETLEAKRDKMKEVNLIVRQYFKNGDPNVTREQRTQCIEDLQLFLGYERVVIEKMIQPNHFGRVVVYEPYQLTNLGAEIRRLKKRTKEVDAVQTLEINDSFENGITVDISEDQKICIHFGFKPDEETRRALKNNAFKWSRNRTAWVRKLTSNAYYSYVREIKPILEKIEDV